MEYCSFHIHSISSITSISLRTNLVASIDVQHIYTRCSEEIWRAASPVDSFTSSCFLDEDIATASSNGGTKAGDATTWYTFEVIRAGLG